MKRLRKILTIALAMIGLITVFSGALVIFRSDVAVESTSDRWMDLALAEAALALKSRDIPVGAVLVEADSVLGKGHNSVRLDSLAGGHAEMNAISQALAGNHFRGFHGRDLVLYTTLEPCEMCAGAIRHYGIRHVVILQPLGPLERWRRLSNAAGYVWRMGFEKNEDKQEALFRQHPDYRQ